METLYLLKTIFEDDRDNGKIFFNTRIVRVTETLLYCARLYNRLEIDPTTVVNVAIRHGGLKGRVLGATSSRRLMREGAPSVEDEVVTEIRCTLSQLESQLVDRVKQLLAPLFIMFDFFELPDDGYEEIVNAFVQGRVV